MIVEFAGLRADAMSPRSNGKRPRSEAAPAPVPYTVSIALVHGMLEGARRRGMAPAPLLRAVGIPPPLMAQGGARISTDQYIRLLRLLIDQLNDEMLGLLTRPLKPGSMALISRSALDGSNLEQALRQAGHVTDLLQDDLHLELARRQGSAALIIHLRGATWRPRFLHEYVIRVFWRLAAWLAGGSLPAQRFDFAFEPPDYAHQYGVTFPASVHFDQPHSAFWFDARRLARKIARDRHALDAFASSWPALMIVPKRDHEGIVARLRAHIERHRPHWPGLEPSAAALHMSAPTLQRQLADAGTSFRAIKDELRRDVAIVRLATGHDSFAELAAELGFSDSATFQRAFKGWTGSPPGAYRSRD